MLVLFNLFLSPSYFVHVDQLYIMIFVNDTIGNRQDLTALYTTVEIRGLSAVWASIGPQLHSLVVAFNDHTMIRELKLV